MLRERPAGGCKGRWHLLLQMVSEGINSRPHGGAGKPPRFGQGVWHSKALLVGLPGADWLMRTRIRWWVADRLRPQCSCGAGAWCWLMSAPPCRVVPGQDLQAALDERFGSDRACAEYRDMALAITDTTRKVGCRGHVQARHWQQNDPTVGLFPLLLQWELPSPLLGVSEDRSRVTTYSCSSQEGDGPSCIWSLACPAEWGRGSLCSQALAERCASRSAPAPLCVCTELLAQRHCCQTEAPAGK